MEIGLYNEPMLYPCGIQNIYTEPISSGVKSTYAPSNPAVPLNVVLYIS